MLLRPAVFLPNSGKGVRIQQLRNRPIHDGKRSSRTLILLFGVWKLTLELQVPLWTVALVWSIGVSILGDRMSESRALLLSMSAGYSMVITIAVCCVYGFTARYVLLIVMATGVWSTLPLGASFAATTFRDMAPEARAVAIALTGVGSQAGNIYGAYLFPFEAAPKYLFGFGTIAGTQFVSSLLFLATFLLLRRRQAKRDLREERAPAVVLDR